MREPVRKVAVVRQQERAGGVDVQPPHGNDAHVLIDELHDRRPPLRIACRRHDARRLVQQDVGKALRRHLAPIELDSIATPDERVQLTQLPVHSDPPGLDQLVRLTARGHTRAGEIGVQAHPGGLPCRSCASH
jgi:hypothetical protein